MSHNYRKIDQLESHIAASMGDIAPDLLIQGGEIVNVITGEIYNANIATKGDRIVRVGSTSDLVEKYGETKTIDATGSYLIPGLVESHLHIESTFLPPTYFAATVLPRGTTTAVVDPHEVMNVLGVRGLELFKNETKNLPLEILVEIPSCVPAAPPLETISQVVTVEEYERIISDPDYFALAEMMNFPGVLYRDKEVLAKLSLSEQFGKLVEGHSPGLSGKELQSYLTAGIWSDHEASEAAEAIEKLRLGMAVQIREGSFTKDLLKVGRGIMKELSGAKTPWQNVIIASDDRHADDLFAYGHLDHSLRLLVQEVGLDPVTAVQVCSYNVARYLRRSDIGLLGPGRRANIVRVDNLRDFTVLDVVAQGQHIAHAGKLLTPLQPPSYPDWALTTVKPLWVPEVNDIFVPGPPGLTTGTAKAHIIGIQDHSIVTDHIIREVTVEGGKVLLKPEDDLAMFFILNRYGQNKNFARSLISGFAFNQPVGFASTVAHDSHQLLIAGNDPPLIHAAMNLVLEANGGQAYATQNAGGEVESNILPLPYAGLMSNLPPAEVVARMTEMKEKAKKLSGKISEPFMALSFLGLPVIPKLKLTDKGLVDVEQFKVIDLYL